MNRLHIICIICTVVLFIAAILILLYTNTLTGLLLVSAALVLLASTYTVPSRHREQQHKLL